MADVSVNALTSLTTPANDDLVPIWDTSAGQLKQVRRDALNGGTLTGSGTVATGGFTLTVPATGSAALLGTVNVFTVGQTLPAARTSGTNTINDDVAISFTPSGVTATALAAGSYAGLLLIWGRFGSGGNQGSVVAFRAGTSAFCAVVAQPSTLVAATTGALAGTTGTDGKLNVSVHTDGAIYIENRTGAQINIGYMILG
jgi:hypothetical protein